MESVDIDKWFGEESKEPAQLNQDKPSAAEHDEKSSGFIEEAGAKDRSVESAVSKRHFDQAEVVDRSNVAGGDSDLVLSDVESEDFNTWYGDESK